MHLVNEMTTRRRTSFTILLFLTFFIASSCTGRGPAHEKKPVWTNFETGANVKALAFQGEDLWMGLPNGIIRYNTRTLDSHDVFTSRSTGGGLINNGIYTLKRDPQGILWIGTYGGGLVRFDGNAWTTYTPFGEGSAVSYGRQWKKYMPGEGVGDLWVYDLTFDASGVLWIATWKGVSRFDGHRFRTLTEADGLIDKWVYAIVIDGDGILWFGTEAGVSRYDGHGFRNFTHADGLGASASGGVKGGASESPSEGQGYHHLDPGKKTSEANPNFVIAAAVDREGHKWFGTWGAGLSRFDGRTWTTYTTRDGLGGNFIHAVAVDSRGLVWTGTDGGVSRFDGRTWTTYTTQDGLLNNNVFSIAFDAQGRPWFGTWTGLSLLEER